MSTTRYLDIWRTDSAYIRNHIAPRNQLEFTSDLTTKLTVTMTAYPDRRHPDVDHGPTRT